MKKVLAILGSSGIVFGGFILIFLCSIAAILQKDTTTTTTYVEAATNFPSAVESYRTIVYKACETYHNKSFEKTCGQLTEYVDLALAIMTEESHGAGTDPMQSSQCGYNKNYPQEANGIQDPVYSIECGVQYMRDALITAKVKSPTDYGRIGIAVQGYNFGIAKWCQWIEKHGGEYTVALATQYQKEVMNGAGTPTHAEKVLSTYKSAMATQSNPVDTDIDINNLETILSLNSAQAWRLVCGGNITSHPTSSTVSENHMKERVSTIAVTVWDFKNSTGIEKKSVTKNITVNSNLVPFWKAFFQEVYQHEDKIVIHELAGYCYRAKRSSSSLSSHSFGTAIDINWSTSGNGWQVAPLTKAQWKNLRGREKELTIYKGCPLVEIAKKYTLSWGGEWNSVKDPMHFSYIGDVDR